VANSVCLATRVRVDILKAIAKQFSDSSGEIMYVSAYMSRPVLHIRKLGDQADQRPFVMTFADAIGKFGAQFAQSRLGEAYKRAGRAFVGQIEQNLVVLKGNLQDPQFQLAASNQSRKRPLVEEKAGVQEV
jgi:hypothetical protein